MRLLDSEDSEAFAGWSKWLTFRLWMIFVLCKFVRVVGVLNTEKACVSCVDAQVRNTQTRMEGNNIGDSVLVLLVELNSNGIFEKLMFCICSFSLQYYDGTSTDSY